MSIRVSVPAYDVEAMLEVSAMFARLADRKMQGSEPIVQHVCQCGSELGSRCDHNVPVECEPVKAFYTAPMPPVPCNPHFVPPAPQEVNAEEYPYASDFIAPPPTATPVEEYVGAPQSYSAPTPPMPQAPPSVTGVELDSRGLPWDQRIHAGTRTKCKTGEWKNAKGVDKDLLAAVESELKAVMSIPAAATMQPAAVAPPAPEPPPAPTAVPPMPQAPSVPAVPAPTPVPPAGAPTSFPDFLKVVTAKVGEKAITYQHVTDACQKHGLAGIPLLNARPDLIPAIYAELEAVWATA